MVRGPLSREPRLGAVACCLAHHGGWESSSLTQRRRSSPSASSAWITALGRVPGSAVRRGNAAQIQAAHLALCFLNGCLSCACAQGALCAFLVPFQTAGPEGVL